MERRVDRGITYMQNAVSQSLVKKNIFFQMNTKNERRNHNHRRFKLNRCWQ